jgi:C1A family cysteine protease
MSKFCRGSHDIILDMRNLILFLLTIQPLFAETSFDLRDNGFTSSPKKQSWGTCWAFASIASMESNILIQRSWTDDSEVDLSEYHMDKYSGFNRNGHKDHLKHDSHSGQGGNYIGSSTDDPSQALIVHLGGDFKVAAAYLSNIGGAVEEVKTPYLGATHNFHERFGQTKKDGVLFENNYKYYLPNSIEWLTHGSFEVNIERIKESIVQNGSVASSQYMQDDPWDTTLSGEEVHFYVGSKEATHAVNIIGWDDERVVIPFQAGVWIVQDSDHINEVSGHIGYFLTPYADIHTGQDKEFGGVSFNHVLPLKFKNIYSHALHGWQYNFSAEKVSNLYELNEELPTKAGIYTAIADDSAVVIIKDLKGNILCHSRNRSYPNPGFYLLELICGNKTKINEMVRVELITESRLYAYDAHKVYRPLLKGSALPEWGEPILVKSKSSFKESYYYKNGKWIDFKAQFFPTEEQYGVKLNRSSSGNFAINLYTN